ncbi:MAG: hypothetical protein KJ061_11115 [Vicinamibacteraceae bacterium]|nr:hypothetical protein [Vicinamibacteraceae bacterium]
MRALRSLVFPAVVVLAAASVAAQTPSAREIVDRHLAARGGAEKLRAVKALRMKGEVAARGMSSPMTITIKRPNLVRQELEVQGQTIVQAFDGRRGWLVNPIVGMKTPTEVPAPPGSEQRNQFDGLLLDFEQRGTKVEVVGREAVNGVETWHLRATPAQGPPQDLFVDANTGLEVKTTVRLEQGGESIEIETFFDDYREVGGIKLPYRIRVVAAGETQQEMTFESIEVLDDVDDSVFQMPRPSGA